MDAEKIANIERKLSMILESVESIIAKIDTINLRIDKKENKISVLETEINDQLKPQIKNTAEELSLKVDTQIKNTAEELSLKVDKSKFQDLEHLVEALSFSQNDQKDEIADIKSKLLKLTDSIQYYKSNMRNNLLKQELITKDSICLSMELRKRKTVHGNLEP